MASDGNKKKAHKKEVKTSINAKDKDTFFSAPTDCKWSSFFPLRCLVWDNVGTGCRCRHLEIEIDPKTKEAKFSCKLAKVKFFGAKKVYKGDAE